ncbi:metallophosphoesterase [Aurantivibrio infirmus]
MRLFAISDLHLDHRANREAIDALEGHQDDWLILAGDIASTAKQLESCLQNLSNKFARMIWVPGNHELWVTQSDQENSSVEKYQALVDLCRRYDVSTPEDPYLLWEGAGGDHIIAPLTLLYDYSFRPDSVALADAVEWATESGVLCKDEHLFNTAPYPSIVEWCRARVEYSSRRLETCDKQIPLVLVNHFPLRYDLVRTMRIPRFSIWCGTKHTEDWHLRFNAKAVVSGHLHMRATDYKDGVRFEEVSLGYPRDWRSAHGPQFYMREILPGPEKPYHHAGPFWRF